MVLIQMKVFYWIKFVEYVKLLKTQDNICYNMNFAFILSYYIISKTMLF